MFRHIVCFKFKESEKHRTHEARERLEALTAISCVRHLEVGLDEKHSARSCDLVLITDFDTREDYETYDTHPLHQPVRAFMHSVYESSVSADFYRENS